MAPIGGPKRIDASIIQRKRSSEFYKAQHNLWREGIIMKILLALTILASTASAAICPRCGKDHAVTSTKSVSSAQQVAQVRANWMASRNRMQHPPFSVGNIRQLGAFFEGVGIGNQSCMAPRGYRFAATATATSKTGRTYRVRIWVR